MTAVTIDKLTKDFARVRALDEVSFDIPRGSLFGLLGPNGAGKTTLFSLAAGFLKPTSGRIEVLGIDVKEISRLRGRLSMLPQDAAFQGGIPVLEQLVMFARLNNPDPVAARESAQNALEIVGLGDVGRKAARTLSHGMMKRVALCQAFLGNPEVVFLDEPTSGLDPDSARKMRDLILSMRGERTVVISSHNLREIQELCDSVAILNEGDLVEWGSMEELTASSHLLRVTLAGPLSPAAEAALMGLPVVTSLEKTSATEFNLRLQLEVMDKNSAMKAIYGCLQEQDIYPRSVFEGESLEARFLEITGGTYDGSSST